ncbi:hypothetical protein EWH08_10710 [Sphingobium indicum]|uniref:Uncharacterized protein n=2 Tax=Sphingobium indicum TaxID=332055 RepID=A0A1L5BQV2_SPHIB|nr:hypothetical protein [Sphingobium indicum]APL95253.1 hypothetical protein SIDU_12430 [Sphingobium indicum B90A]KEY99872.1 hypothetical protein AI27_00525 [Sphingomonas sp. BHC-A]NYI22345.1 hypothetical protein [Sphingobium indicum]RYM02650.1 hypothetical protein EWH08_10710 [Sphingobium indicum]
MNDVIGTLCLRMWPRLEGGMAALILPALATAAFLMFFATAYRWVDDLLVAGVIAMVAPMMVLPLLLRRKGVS